jgi:hypothetical protein
MPHSSSKSLPMQASLEAMSAVHSGCMKSDDHKQAIAAAQRRRHAACRVLRAIEEVQSVKSGIKLAAHVVPHGTAPHLSWMQAVLSPWPETPATAFVRCTAPRQRRPALTPRASATPIPAPAPAALGASKAASRRRAHRWSEQCSALQRHRLRHRPVHCRFQLGHCRGAESIILLALLQQHLSLWFQLCWP